MLPLCFGVFLAVALQGNKLEEGSGSAWAGDPWHS